MIDLTFLNEALDDGIARFDRILADRKTRSLAAGQTRRTAKSQGIGPAPIAAAKAAPTKPAATSTKPVNPATHGPIRFADQATGIKLTKPAERREEKASPIRMPK